MAAVASVYKRSLTVLHLWCDIFIPTLPYTQEQAVLIRSWRASRGSTLSLNPQGPNYTSLSGRKKQSAGYKHVFMPPWSDWLIVSVCRVNVFSFWLICRFIGLILHFLSPAVYNKAFSFNRHWKMGSTLHWAAAIPVWLNWTNLVMRVALRYS